MGLLLARSTHHFHRDSVFWLWQEELSLWWEAGVGLLLDQPIHCLHHGPGFWFWQEEGCRNQKSRLCSDFDSYLFFSAF